MRPELEPASMPARSMSLAKSAVVNGDPRWQDSWSSQFK
jgi:hypothetical protein